MNLEHLYTRISEAISTLDFSRIWPGFAPLRFALYDETSCYFNGAYIEKTDDFCANTAIVYRGEPIAIWYARDVPSIPVLTSKIVHEMFHAYQNQQGWTCWADEMEALYQYEYNAENLTLKLRENELLLTILDRFDEGSVREILSLRKLRSQAHPCEYSYESKVEEIEGTATYVEWMVLRQLDEPAAEAMVETMRTTMTTPEALFPIRISCYNSGALMIHALAAAGVYSFASAKRPVIDLILKDTHPADGSFSAKEACGLEVVNAIDAFYQESERMIRAAIEKNEVVISSTVELVCVNIYDARFYKGYIISRLFLMYQDETGEKTLHGNFVLQVADKKTITRVYRLDEALTE